MSDFMPVPPRASGPADWVLTGGVVWPASGPAIAGGAVAVRGDRIAAVGTAAEVEPLIGPGTRILRLAPSQMVIPGFNDSHQHLFSYVRARHYVPLWDTASVAEELERIRLEAARRPPGTWIKAVGHDQGRLAERRHPTRQELDAAAPHHPVLVRRSCGHISIVNSRALEAAGITDQTPDPPGGRLERVDGRLTGVLLEAAQDLVDRVIPPPDIDWARELVQAAGEYHRRGITSVGEAAVHDQKEWERLRKALERGMALRVYAMPHGQLAEQLLQEGLRTGAGDAWLRVGAVKLFADGTLGGGTAYLTEGYRDEPQNRGWPVVSADALNEVVERYHRAGFQVATHAIGDAAVAMVLDAYERAMTRHPRADPRHRVEHVESVHPGLPERMAALGVVASVQSCFTFWEFGDVTRLGPGLSPWGHPWGSLFRAGVKMSNGSDNPVLPDFSPLQGIYAAVARRTHAGLVLAPHQRMEVAEALWTYTAGGAYASFEEALKGTLRPGQLADIVVLSGNLLETDPEALLQLSVDLTMVGGRIVFERA